MEHASSAMTDSAKQDNGYLNQTRNSPDNLVACGIASVGDSHDLLRHKQRQDRLPAASVPVVDLFRDKSRSYMEDERHLHYHAGNEIELDKNRLLDVDDFRPDYDGTNAAQRHMQAAEIKRNSNHTRDLEEWAFDAFVDHARQLVMRHQTGLGILYLHDFISTFLDHPPSHELLMQLFTLQNHTRDPTLKRCLSKISERTSNGELVYQWLVDLIAVIHMIFRDEQSVRERLTALLTTVNHISLHFAKKAVGGRYPSSDKLAKTHTYFKRIVLALLSLADSIGCYSRNSTPPRYQKRMHIMPETSDESYMFSLKGALESPDTDEDADSEPLWMPA